MLVPRCAYAPRTAMAAAYWGLACLRWYVRATNCAPLCADPLSCQAVNNIACVPTGTNLTEAQMQAHPKRSELRSALGLAPDQLVVTGGDGAGPVQAGDVFMLCTDGLWEYLGDEVLERTLAGAGSPRAWLDALAAEVAAATHDKASHDNYTALVVWTRDA
jgi:hypothetical protein